MPQLLIASLVLSLGGCASMCRYTATGQVVVPLSYSESLTPPLAEVISQALKPLGFSRGEEVHIPGYPLGHHRSEPIHDYIDFVVMKPQKFVIRPEVHVLVRVEPRTGAISVSDFLHDATQPESKFVKKVRENVQAALWSAYGVKINIAKDKQNRARCLETAMS